MTEKTLRIRLFTLANIFVRPMTMGMRGAAFDAQGRIFLVRHTYVPGWYMPGGGLDVGEPLEHGLARELREEGNLEMQSAPELFGIYYNKRASPRDHVALYRCLLVRQTAPKPADREIAESGFFALDDLPQGTTPSTLRRIAEMTQGAERDLYW